MSFENTILKITIKRLTWVFRLICLFGQFFRSAKLTIFL